MYQAQSTMIRQFINAVLVVLIALVLSSFAGGQKTKKDGRKRPAAAAAAAAGASAPVSYKNDIRPIVKRYCLPCHSEDEMNPSELYLDTYENMIAGGKHGKPVTPGNPDSSLLIRKLEPPPPFGDPMPLKRKAPFPADTLQIIRTWIQQGAKNN